MICCSSSFNTYFFDKKKTIGFEVFIGVAEDAFGIWQGVIT
jgi:hypothetical protein